MKKTLLKDGTPLASRIRTLVDQWSEAKITLKQITGLSEEELYTIAAQGYHLFLQGKTDEARVIFEGLLAIDPRNPYYYRALGAIYWRLKQAEKAIRQFSYAIRVAPHEISAYINRAEIYVASKQFDMAREDLHHALANAAPHEEALAKKARAMLQMI